MMTFDASQITQTGAFLIGELERLDQTLHMPLVDFKWARDITLRTDVTIADDATSFILANFASVGGAQANGKNFIGLNSSAIASVQVGNTKVSQPMTPWAMSVDYSIIELAKSMQTNRPVDNQKHEGMKLKFNMDVDEQVYMGDESINVKGLLNQDIIAPENATDTWDKLTHDQILEEMNGILTTAWANSGYAIVPSDVLLPPTVYGSLVTRKVSEAGNISILKYLEQNSICNAENGKELSVRPSKWCTKAGTAKKGRVMAYTNRNDIVRFPLVSLSNLPLQYDGIHQKTVYYGALGVVEVVRPETIMYLDGVSA